MGGYTSKCEKKSKSLHPIMSVSEGRGLKKRCGGGKGGGGRLKRKGFLFDGCLLLTWKMDYTLDARKPLWQEKVNK